MKISDFLRTWPQGKGRRVFLLSQCSSSGKGRWFLVTSGDFIASSGTMKSWQQGKKDASQFELDFSLLYNQSMWCLSALGSSHTFYGRHPRSVATLWGVTGPLRSQWPIIHRKERDTWYWDHIIRVLLCPPDIFLVEWQNSRSPYAFAHPLFWLMAC